MLEAAVRKTGHQAILRVTLRGDVDAGALFALPAIVRLRARGCRVEIGDDIDS